MVGAGEVYDCGFDDVLAGEAVGVAITLTLTLSHQGRGDKQVLPEGVLGVGGVVSHLAREVFELGFYVWHGVDGTRG